MGRDMGLSMQAVTEEQACTPMPMDARWFNQKASLPHGCTVDSIRASMQDFLEFLEFVNCSLHTRGISRLESMLIASELQQHCR